MAEEAKETTKTKTEAPKDLIGFLNYYLVTKAPFQIPAEAKEWIVKYLPWINLAIVVLLSPAILLALGLGAIALPFAGLAGAGVAGGLGLALIMLVVQVVLLLAAFPGLRARKLSSGWNLELYGVGLNLLYSVVSNPYSIITALITTLIGLYILFQIRSYYK